MKNHIYLLFLSVLFCLQVQAKTNRTSIQLNKNWEFSEANSNKWLTATVPGTVQGDLLDHQLLPNPFFGTNEEKIQWVENKDWEYKTSFELTEEQLQADDISLVFEGLDTYSDVYLNGSLLLKSDNMFVSYEKTVKKLLRIGTNRLHIYFHSPISQVLPQWESNGFNYPADNDHHEKKLSIFTRKAPYSYGWDWGIRMVTSGIWRPINLVFYRLASIEDFHVRQISLNNTKAELINNLELRGVRNESEKAILILTCSLDGKTVLTEEKNVEIQPGKNCFSIPISIDNPIRWMPHGWGDPVLYTMHISLKQKDEILAEKSQRIGFRTIRLVNEKDAWGESFYFEVNGIPMYAKGANYIPSDAILPHVATERYTELFQNITAANMNMIRVWGGGTYEDDRFYDLADENGILIWQDFLFGCTTYPHDAAFLKRVEEETSYNIKRLRNHACLAMWCGNNEILEGMHHWDWEKRYTAAIYKEMFAGYDRIFRKLLPDQVEKYDAGRSYIHGSPLSTNWGHPEGWNNGDSHNWGVWYGKKKFESFDTETGRFMSEFGFQSFPEMKTIATFANPEDYALESTVMNAHQKSTIGNSLIKTYMERDYILPETFENFVYLGQVLQGKGMRYGFEAQRRNRPYCMGTLYWQLNDSWPVVSWSGIDYYGNWKALHFQAKRAFEPILISPVQKNDSLQVYLVSDLLKTKENLKLKLQWRDFQGKKIKNIHLITSLKANTSANVFSKPIKELLSDDERKNTYLELTLIDSKNNKLASQVYFINKTKDLNLPKPRIIMEKHLRKGSCELRLKTDKLAKDVFIEIPLQGAKFSDNFFDMQPGETKTVIIKSPFIDQKTIDQITIKNIRETYN